MMTPFPRQRGHGCESANSPWLSETTPEPPHCGHVFGLVPGSAPVPPQTWQAVSTSTGTRTVAPLSASSNEILTRASRSTPRCGRGRSGPRRPRPKRPPSPPNRSERSPRSTFSTRTFPKPPNGPAPDSPNVSYCLRFSASESRSYADWTSLKRSSAAASPGLRSGWSSRASLRYAFLISSSVAEAVALLHDFQHRARLHTVARLREQRLVDVRVERSVGLDLGEAFPLERGLKRALDEAYPLDHGGVVVDLGGVQRALEVVHDREKLLHEPLVGPRDERLLVADGPLPVVVEVRREALQVAKGLVPLLN